MNTSGKYAEYEIVQITNLFEIREIIEQFNNVFKPSLSERISSLNAYADKLHENSIFISVKKQDEVVGFASFYANDIANCMAYLTQLAVLSEFQKKKLGKLLLDSCIKISLQNGMTKMKLEVYNDNSRAIDFYKKSGFVFLEDSSEQSKFMIKNLY
jgi:ribosomal protein S18 acetylase RimI-like enzyme